MVPFAIAGLTSRSRRINRQLPPEASAQTRPQRCNRGASSTQAYTDARPFHECKDQNTWLPQPNKILCDHDHPMRTRSISSPRLAIATYTLQTRRRKGGKIPNTLRNRDHDSTFAMAMTTSTPEHQQLQHKWNGPKNYPKHTRGPGTPSNHTNQSKTQYGPSLSNHIK